MAFLTKHHTIENRRKALEFFAAKVPEVDVQDDATVSLSPFGTCRFAAYTHEKGAMVSSEDHPEYGSAEWHARDNLMLFRETGDGRALVYVCPIDQLFEKRSIGRHGVPWEDVRKASKKIFVFSL